MLGEVLEVLPVQGRKRQAMDQAARSDPGVVGWPGSAAAPGISGYPAPLPRDHQVGVQLDDTAEPVLQPLASAAAPAPHRGPLPQLTHGDERHASSYGRQPRGEGPVELPLDDARRHVGIENDIAHQGQLGQIGAASGVDVREELLQLFVGLEDAWPGHVLDRLDRAHTLAPGQLLDRDRSTVGRLRLIVRPVRGHQHLPGCFF